MSFISQFIQKRESTEQREKRLRKQIVKEKELISKLTPKAEKLEKEMERLYTESFACEARGKEAFAKGDYTTPAKESAKRIEVNNQYLLVKNKAIKLRDNIKYANIRIQQIEIELGLREAPIPFDYGEIKIPERLILNENDEAV